MAANNKDRRCPWGGKKLKTRRLGFKKLKFNLTVVHHCSNCGGALSSWASSVVLIFILIFAALCWLNGNIVLALYIFVPLLAVCLAAFCFVEPRLHKLNSDGKKVDDAGVRIDGAVQSDRAVPIRRKMIFLTDASFDSAEAYSLSSPVRIVKYCKKTGRVTFEFIYSNEATRSLASADELMLYTSDSNEPLNVVINKKQ